MTGGDDSLLWAFNHKSEWQSKSRQTRPLCLSFNVPWLSYFSEQLLKIQSSKIDAFRYLFTVLSPHGQVDKQYGQIAWLKNEYLLPHNS
jgi:hypothetical protein